MPTKPLFAVVIAVLCGCAPPIPKPQQPSGDTLGILIFTMTVRGREFPATVPHRIQTAYFAQVGVDGKLDFDQPILSNYRVGDYVVLLNAPPGRYAPVAGAYYHRNVRYLVKLPHELSEGWITTVRPGCVAFVGDALLRTEWEGALKAVGNFFKNAGAWIVPFMEVTIPVEAGSPRLDRENSDEASALHALRRKLEKTMWREPIDRRLAEVGNPPEPIRVGKIFKTIVQPTPAGRFGYIDTLKWGKPIKVTGGLEWREPKGRALIQVYLLEPGMRGYKPRGQYLYDMRVAGSPEDAHDLFSVSLASRTATGVRYTTYQYPEAKLTGTDVKVYETETLLVPDDESFYLLRLRAPRANFQKYVPAFRKFLSYLVFLPKEKPT